MKDNAIEHKSKTFAVRIIRLYQFLSQDKKEYVLSKQILRSGTSIGANVREALQGFSRGDFLYKINLALKECSETCYWLELLHETDYLSQSQFNSLHSDATELFKLLTAIVKSTKIPETD